MFSGQYTREVILSEMVLFLLFETSHSHISDLRRISAVLHFCFGYIKLCVVLFPRVRVWSCCKQFFSCKYLWLLSLEVP